MLDPVACLIKTSRDLAHQIKCPGSPRPANPAWPGPRLALPPLAAPHTPVPAALAFRIPQTPSLLPPGLHMLFSRPAMCFPRVPISLNSVPTPSPTRVALCYTQTGFLDSAYCDQQMFHIWLCPALVAAGGIFPFSTWAPECAGSVLAAHGLSSCGLWGSVP